MKYIIVQLSIVLAIIMVSGCGESTTPSENKPQTINPLLQGNRWNYHSVWYKSPNNSTTIKEEKKYSIEVVGKEIIKGKEYALLQYSDQDKPSLAAYNDNTGYWQNSLDNPILMAAFPCKTGDTWVRDTIPRTDEQGNKIGTFTTRMTVISTNTKRNVYNKDYICYHYQETYNELNDNTKISDTQIDYFYAVNIGLVEMVMTDKGKEIRTLELMSASLQ